MEYTSGSVDIRQTEEYAAWFASLDDRQARARILARIRRVSLGSLGDVRPVGGGVLELRVHCGPGYRIYAVRRTHTVVLLNGGDKRTQRRDIKRARRLARRLEE